MPKVYDKVTSNIKPDWLKIRLHRSEQFAQVERITREHGLHTICSSGRCPNKAECWSNRTATFMILGEICTRSCRFCATATGKALPPDEHEPARVAESIRLMELRHAVITSVTRDDLPDGGARHWAETVRRIRETNPATSIELLIPDMDGRPELIDTIAGAGADIMGHNLETVERLTPRVRSRARYDVSLRTIGRIASRGVIAKSGIMVGLGETDDEVLHTMDDLAGAGCSIITVGQYLRPTLAHLPVEEYVTPEKFEWFRDEAVKRGFRYAACGPMVRSSYKAHEALEACLPLKND